MRVIGQAGKKGGLRNADGPAMSRRSVPAHIPGEAGSEAAHAGCRPGGDLAEYEVWPCAVT